MLLQESEMIVNFPAEMFMKNVEDCFLSTPNLAVKLLVYLNGLMSDEDTLVRVKHRREKSNSIGHVANGSARRLRVRR
ncbi:hypothetical protein NECAME_13024 [Necator americanus]|uniref:Uncharacterized protein n=1 Tax=Necator americanus TaxID=51031 RepID=W2T049_NECAM|nr:hypothetical protein NECAME_13024 [Necator americanus]ETN74337.1 hypothetical protein NECAME_13024 [Necator americanus]